MTTPPTPAGWYPDPEQAGLLRYWDGGTWTEHRSPAQDPAAPTAQEPFAEPTAQEPSGSEHVGSHRAPEPDPEPLSVTEQPTTKVPLRDWTPEPPPELSDWASEPAPEPMTEPTTDPTLEQTPEPSFEPAPLSLTEQPTTRVPLREPAPYADATTSTPPEPQAVEPPAGTEPQAPVDNRKLVMGFGGAVAGLLLVLILAAVYAFVIHKPDTVQLSSPTTETSTTTVEETTTDEATSTDAATPPPLAGAVDGPLTFSVTGVESGTTVTDSENEFLTKDAQGEFIVVRLTVQNTSADPGQFLGTFQKLNAGGQVYTIDDEATFYVGGGFVDIPPGGQVDVGLAYDVPPGTVPESVELHADPMSPGVVLPVG